MGPTGSKRAPPANPFDDPELAARYEDWYLGPGASADRLEKELLSKALETFPERKTLLEVGCGTGHFVRWFEDQGLATAGVDISTTMLAEARRRGTSACVAAEASALPFADRSFDLVALVATLEFLPEPARALQEAVRVARHGLVLGTFNRFSLYALGRRLRSSPVWQRAHFFGPVEMRRLAAEAAGSRARGVLRWAASWSLIPCGDFIATALRLSSDE
ncbi:MAG TPA: class I SAM-dependent methyltransferase [Vicinamibacteria bacterium]|nr:class I SAM-dependent methyltransferase [Vicinamibacteria bacterium]